MRYKHTRSAAARAIVLGILAQYDTLVEAEEALWGPRLAAIDRRFGRLRDQIYTDPSACRRELDAFYAQVLRWYTRGWPHERRPGRAGRPYR